MNGFVKNLFFAAVCLSWSNSVLSVESGANNNIVVVVKATNKTDKLSKSQVIDLFMGKYVAFPNGKKARPLDIVDSKPLKKQFYQSLVGLSLARVNSYWSRIQFSGRGKPSIKKESEKDIIRYLLNSDAAISYLHRENLTDELKIVYELSSDPGVNPR